MIIDDWAKNVLLWMRREADKQAGPEKRGKRWWMRIRTVCTTEWCEGSL